MTAEVNSGLTYVITNVKAGTVIDLSAGDNKTVTGWAYNGGTNQKWTMNWVGNGWTFQNQNTQTYLGIEGTPADGLPLVAVSTPFTWHIWRDETNSSTYRIFVPNTIYNLDLFGYGLTTSGDPIQLWTTWSGLHQTWTFGQA
jgi:hypothetical protein